MKICLLVKNLIDKYIIIQEFYHLISSKYPKKQYKLFKTSPSSELNELNITLEQEKHGLLDLFN